MKFAFWRKKDPSKLTTLSWNLMIAAINPDSCWEFAKYFRETGIPGNVLTCETSFLMGSVVRDIIRSSVPEELHPQCIESAVSAYYKTFDDHSSEPLPPEMTSVYGGLTLGQVSRIALAAYGAEGDSLFLTLATFVRRIKGDPRMKAEVSPLLEERRSVLSNAFSKAIK